MPEQIYKLQPNRTLQLRGFNALGASAALHSATAHSFKVSGIFRDAADFAVLLLWDADNFYEHPSVKYLPDFDFSGLTLSFDVSYGTGLQPIDSPKYNWIDWATLDCVLADGSSRQVRLWDDAALVSGAFSVASGVFDLQTGPNGPQPYDRVTLWFQNLAYDYIVPGDARDSAEFQFFAGGTGKVHSITIDQRTYSHTESDPAGESSAAQANALVAAVNSGQGDPNVTAAIGSASNAVKLTVRQNAAGQRISASATDGNQAVTLHRVTVAGAAAALCDQINRTDWIRNNGLFALRAASAGSSITIKAARYGTVDTSGSTVSWRSGAPFTGVAPNSTMRIASTDYTILSVDSSRQVTLTTSAGTQTNVPYSAERGGLDGNMLGMYSLNKTPTLKCAQSSIHFNGGSSDVTWRCSLDFTSRSISQLRQCWLTFAPPLANGAAFKDTEWQASFSNWVLSGPASRTALKVAGPGSVRIEEDDVACVFTGDWAVETGFYSQGFAKRCSTIGDSVTLSYTCQLPHDVYIGTSLYVDRGVIGIRLDGDPETTLDCSLKSDDAVNTRRRVRSTVAAGTHTVTLTFKSGRYFYFDFLEAAVPSDVPDPPPPRTDLSPALDYSTDHTYKLSPSRLLWNMDHLGMTGPMNEYIGVFWWNQRVRTGGIIPSVTVTFSGTWSDGDSAFLTLGGASIGKSVFPGDTPSTIATHFATLINGSFVAVWAAAQGSTLTITSRSPTASYALSFQTSKVSSAGQITVSGSFAGANEGTWEVDPAQTPALNRGAREWHSDFYRECQSRSREVVTAASMELVHPPSGFAAVFPDNTGVETSVGFGNLRSTHCSQGSLMRSYQQSVYETIAGLMAGAGLTPAIQFGEFLWWFFTNYTPANPNGGMAYYDAETKAAAQAALGRPLHVFRGPDDDPGVNNGADATFLRNRLRDHVASLVASVRARYPSTLFEVLFPFDVNHPTPVGSPYQLGGRLNRYVNFPVEWQRKQTSGFDRLKMEALAFGADFCNLDLARTAMAFPFDMGWPGDSVRYLVPVFKPARNWQKEYSAARAEGIRFVNLWAFDQVCLYGLNIREQLRARSTAINT